MNTTPHPVPLKAYRITLTLDQPHSRMDNVLLDAMREQTDNDKIAGMSRTALKELFNKKRIMIKGQRAKSSSALAAGTTYVDVLGFGEA